MRLRASLAILLLGSGCTTTYNIPKSELSKLDGWADDGKTLVEDVGDALRGQRKDVRRLLDEEGREHRFHKDTPLVLVRTSGEELTESYSQVTVDAQLFRGVPTERPGRPVELPLEQVQAAGVRKFSLGKTVLLTGGIALGAFASLVAVGLALDDGTGGGGGDLD